MALDYSLGTGTRLRGGSYRIERCLKQGGFGIVYLAEQVDLGRMVCIKEFFPGQFCDRPAGATQVTTTTSGSGFFDSFKKKFVREAQRIAQLQHPAIVHVHDVFEENGTAYYVMSYLDGGSLRELVERQGPLTLEEASKYIEPVASALEYLHRKVSMCHLDVKPSNVMLDEDGKVYLIDFGSSKQYDAAPGSSHTTTLPTFTPGYAPPEQMAGNVKSFSPTADTYALTATLYFLLTGKDPVDASVRISEGDEAFDALSLPKNVVEFLHHGMSLPTKARFQTMGEWHAAYSAMAKEGKGAEPSRERTTVASSEEKTKPSLEKQSPKQAPGKEGARNRRILIAFVVAGMAVGALLFFNVRSKNASENEQVAVEAAHAEMAAQLEREQEVARQAEERKKAAEGERQRKAAKAAEAKRQAQQEAQREAERQAQLEAARQEELRKAEEEAKKCGSIVISDISLVQQACGGPTGGNYNRFQRSNTEIEIKEISVIVTGIADERIVNKVFRKNRTWCMLDSHSENFSDFRVSPIDLTKTVRIEVFMTGVQYVRRYNEGALFESWEDEKQKKYFYVYAVYTIDTDGNVSLRDYQGIRPGYPRKIGLEEVFNYCRFDVKLYFSINVYNS